MKKLLTIILFFSVIITKGQEFMGVKIDGTKPQAIQKFIAKGFKVKKQDDTWVQMLGVFNKKEVELYLSFTPISKKFWKLTVYFPESNNWSTLKNDYFYYKKILTEKYGEPTQSYESFLSPYEEGDGYEISAIVLEKCGYASFWLDLVIGLEISKYKQISISYENPILNQLQEKEKNNLDIINL
jgi:hypothetical protein